MRPDALAEIKGRRMPVEHLALVATGGDVDVHRPDGTLLFAVRRNAVPADLNERVRHALRTAAQKYGSDNRASYTGLAATNKRRDGTESNSMRARDPETGKPAQMETAIVGFFDRQGGRWPFCRATAFTADDLQRWAVVEELARLGATILEGEVPERCAAQKLEAARCDQGWIIAGTPFSTLTVNRNVLGAVHKDSGDYPEGFGLITCHRQGSYRGGVLGFPEFFAGADLRDGDAILFDPHAWHAVTDMVDRSEDAERITVVYYLRARISKCESPARELEKAQSG